MNAVATTMGSEDQSMVSRDLDDDPTLSILRERQQEGIMLRGILLKSVIADGGMGTVYKGFHTRLDIPVAVKILKRRGRENLDMFLREARLTAKIGHANLVRIYDVNIEPLSNMNYIVMEYIDGCSAYDLLQRRLKDQNRPLAQVSAVEIVLSASKALGAAHDRDIVHRDVKSENILIRSCDGEVKLADLGLAGASRTFARSGGHHSSMCGTTGFIAPEVVAGGDVTSASDVYAMGVTLYELLTGKLPHAGEQDDTYYSRQLHTDPIDPREHRPSLNCEIVQVVMRCLSRNPEDRYQNANALVSTLEPLLQNLVGQRDSKFEKGEKDLCAHRPTVLCVDDDHNILDLEKEILESQGFQVVCMTDPQQAIRELKTLAPDVAVVDNSMPQMSGTELCHRLRQVSGYHCLGVLMLSGTEHTEIIEKALQHGIADYLCKPIDIGELVARVKLLTHLRILSREKKSKPQ